MCTRSSSTYQCPNNFHMHYNPSCEEEILLQKNSTRCYYTKLNIVEGHVEIVPEVNQYIAIFPEEEKLTIKCPGGTTVKSLTGVYLIKQNNCAIQFKDKTLTYLD